MSSRQQKRKEFREWQKEYDKKANSIKSNPMIANPDEFILKMSRVNMPLDAVEKMVNEAYAQGDAAGCYRTYMYSMAAALMALRDEFHFGHDRGERFIEAMKNKLAFSISGDEDVEEVYKTMGISVDIRDIISEKDAQKYHEELEALAERIKT